MNRVHRSPTRFGTVIGVLAVCVGAGVPAYADDHRIVIGESVYVGSDEVLDQVTCVFCSIHIEGVVTDTAFLVLGELENRGEIQGDAIVIVGEMRLHGNVGGNAVAVMGNIQKGAEEVRIGGDALTVLGSQAGIAPGDVGGKIEQVGGEQVGQVVVLGLVIVLCLLGVLVFLVLMALNLIGYAVLGAERVQTIANTLSGNAAICFLGGLGTCFALAVIGLIVAMILPVSLPMILVFFVLSVVGYCGVTYWIGRNLFSGRAQLAATIAAATLIIVLQLVPVIGWLVALVLWNIAIGAAVLSGFGTSPDWLVSKAGGGSRGRPAR